MVEAILNEIVTANFNNLMKGTYVGLKRYT